MDHLLQHPDAVLKSDGTPYKMFTPFSKAWREKARADKNFAAEADVNGLQCADFAATLTVFKQHGLTLIDPAKGPEAMLKAVGYELQKHDWPADAARKRLHAFAESHIQNYTDARNIMGTNGASRRFALPAFRTAFDTRMRAAGL